MSFPPMALQLAVLLIVTIAAFYDIRYRRIPNAVVLAGLILGLSLNSFLFEWQGFLFAAKGFGLALLVYFPLWAIRAMGAGDAKLMAAIGSMLGAANWLGVFVVTAILGGIAGIVFALARKQLGQRLSNVGFLVSLLLRMQAPYLKSEQLDVKSEKALRMPHGAIIAAASFVFLAAAWKWAPR